MFPINNLIELSEYLVLISIVYGYYRYFVKAKNEINERCEKVEALAAKHARKIDLSLIHTSDEMFRLNSAQVGAVEDLTDRVRTHAKHLSVFQLEQHRDIKLIEQDMAGVVHATKATDVQIDDIWRDMAVMDDKIAENETQIWGVKANVAELTRAIKETARQDLDELSQKTEDMFRAQSAQFNHRFTFQQEMQDEYNRLSNIVEENTKQIKQNQATKERVINQIQMHLDWIASLKTEFPSLKRPPFSYPKKTELTPEEIGYLPSVLFPSETGTNCNKTNRVLLIPSTKAILDKYFDPDQYAIFTEIEYGGIGYFTTQCKTVATSFDTFKLDRSRMGSVNIGQPDHMGFMLKWLIWSVPDIGETDAECELRFLGHVLDVLKTAYNRFKFYKVACEMENPM